METGKNNYNSRLKIGVPDPKLLRGNLPCLALRKVRIHLEQPTHSSNGRDLQSCTMLPQLLGRNKLGHLSLKRVGLFPACDISFPCTLCCENLLPSILTVFKCALEKLAGSVGLSGMQNIQNNPSLLPWFWYFFFFPPFLSCPLVSWQLRVINSS